MKISELRQQLQTNFEVQTKGQRLQQAIDQVLLGKPQTKHIVPGQLYLYQSGQNIVCQASSAQLIIAHQADFGRVFNQINAALQAEIATKNQLLSFGFQKYDLDQLLKIIHQRLKLELLVCDLNNLIIGSEGIFFNNFDKSLADHKHAVEIHDQLVQFGKFYWHLEADSQLHMTAEILQTLSKVLSYNLLQRRIMSPLNSPTEVLLVRLLKSQQTVDVEEYFNQRQTPLPKSMAFIYVTQTTPDKLGKLKLIIQQRFADFFGFSISSVYQGQLISLVKMTLPMFFQTETREFLTEQARDLQVKFLVTNPVQRITELRASHQAALLVLKQPLPARVSFCADAALPLLVEQNFNLRLTNYLLNPVPKFLRDYDQDKGTHLLSALIAYLNNDCSISQTAEQLYLHRNSVTNYLRKIERLTGFNYHEFKQLQSLQFSLAVYSALQKRN
ncbi:MAG: helix-turn-helix domain-containing protein [Lactobacillus sp.]|jgi:hypothetical protein|nr:helix-turn-helix domain-containing protein [Lactobacillus sp.]MCI1973848.1 helix-turn-helix domain-containing protein [Lactobacillus sp.]